MQLVSAFMLAIQAPLPLNHHHHHTGSNHVTPLTVVDLSRTSARDIQFLSTEKSWRSKDNDVKNMFKPSCCKKRAKYETMDSKNSSNKKIILFLDDCTTPATIDYSVRLHRIELRMKREEKELDEKKKRLKEIDDEAAALREMQAKVEKDMGP
ncbi:hypothetical protein Bca52824_046202 [Brassica carinata]|uniref:Uncharacterized protein n=1 Tax=Brassica carinata TaxID=52824 RepID=A0A8X7RC97_BRACI|nr:hypothetical protein Bca52824_046202 [Brassica carinata]